MIYKRFKVKEDTHIAQLHHLIQIIMDWDNDNPHSFIICGSTESLRRIDKSSCERLRSEF